MNRLWRDAGASDRDREEVINRDELDTDDASFALANLQTRFGQLLGLYHEEEDEHDRLKAKYRMIKRRLSASQRNSQLLQRSNQFLQKNNQFLKNKNAVLEKELQACKDDLFRMQPVSPITDSTIAQRFDTLDEAISDWIDTEIARFTDKWEVKDCSNEPKLFHHDDDPALKDFLLKYPSTGGEYVVRYEIHRYLQRALFSDESILFGLHPEDVDLILCIEQGMRGLKPPRDPATIRAWRSEALTPLAGATWLSDNAARLKDQVATDIINNLMGVFPVVSQERVASLESMLKNVIALAVELATMLQTSTTAYKFEPQMSGSSRFKRHSIPKSHLGCYRMIDVATGKSLKPDSPVTPNGEGMIGNQIMTIAPRLFRHDTDKAVPLVQEVVLIELNAPLGRRRGPVV